MYKKSLEESDRSLGISEMSKTKLTGITDGKVGNNKIMSK